MKRALQLLCDEYNENLLFILLITEQNRTGFSFWRQEPSFLVASSIFFFFFFFYLCVLWSLSSKVEYILFLAKVLHNNLETVWPGGHKREDLSTLL